MPIAVVLDLHANVTDAMVRHAHVMDMYRYYPHIDMREAGERAAAGLIRILETGKRPAKAFRQLDFLIPINGGCTDFGPAKSLYLERIPELLDAHEGLDALLFASGFPHADFADVGPSVIAYGRDNAAADAGADALASEIAAREAEFLPEFHAADECVRRALEIARGASRPVVIRS